MTTQKETKYDFPVFATQGGGLARMERDGFVFVEAPGCPGLEVGDYVPIEWGVEPAGNQANRLLEELESDEA